MLPLDGRSIRNYPHVGSNRSFSSSYSSSGEYFRRIYDFHQMDFDAACNQFMLLVSTNPSQVYKSSYYRKQTKNQWARDDPAFAVIEVLLLCISTCAYGVSFGIGGVMHYVTLILQAVLVQFLLTGLIIASVGSWVANKHLVHQRTHAVAQQVEWLYAFDIHCNSFFPLFLILHVLQFFLMPLLLIPSFISLVAANTLYAVALSYYFYITHLGYRSLPFLNNTEVYLYPVAVVVLLYVGSILAGLLGTNINIAVLGMRLYYLR